MTFKRHIVVDVISFRGDYICIFDSTESQGYCDITFYSILFLKRFSLTAFLSCFGIIVKVSTHSVQFSNPQLVLSQHHVRFLLLNLTSPWFVLLPSTCINMPVV